MFGSTGFKPRPKPPMVAKTGIDYIDAIISTKGIDGTGIRGGTWIIISGPTGSGKTTLGLQMLKGLAATNKVDAAHFDYEMGEDKCRSLYEDIGVDDKKVVPVFNYSKDLIAAWREQAKESEKNGKLLAVLLDSFEWVTKKVTDYDGQRDFAKELRVLTHGDEGIEPCRNLIVITVNHRTKSSGLQGVVEVGKYNDIHLALDRKKNSPFVTLTHPKNRDEAPDAPTTVKLKHEKPGAGLVASAEPDFISDNPVISTVRGWFKKKA